ncbi:MAG: dihydroneopterin aldolase [candidate division KSB1 bacterium]|nr:dihydroneopterin aldolase [candidate division KSB1 bacterium]
MLIRIKNLRLRTILGVEDWERRERQDVVINVEVEFDGSDAVQSDKLEHTLDYKALTKRIIQEVESSRFHLLETLAQHVLNLVLEQERVIAARVEVDKPNALRFADSVSVVCSGRKGP